MSPPKISVIIPTYNRCNFLLQALESVFAQTFTDYEVIVIDDGSTDGSEKAVSTQYGKKVHYVWQENQGRSTARNHGIHLAKGKYVALLDSDDLWLPEKLADQVFALDKDPGLGVIFCQAYYMDETGNIIRLEPMGSGLQSSDFIFEKLILFNHIPGADSTGLFQKKVFDEIGGFDPLIAYGEDWELCLRILKRYRMNSYPKTLACIRLHPGQQTNIKDKNSIICRHRDKLYTLAKIGSYYDQPEQQLLIQHQLNKIRIQTGISLFSVGEVKVVKELFQQVVESKTELGKDKSFLEEQILSTAKNRYDKCKCIAEVEDYVMNALFLCNSSLGTNFFEKQVIMQFYEMSFWWLYHDNQISTARAIWFKILKQQPRKLFNSIGIKMSIYSVFDRRIISWLVDIYNKIKRI